MNDKGTSTVPKTLDDVIALMLSARTGPELDAAERAQADWIAAHPEDKDILLMGGEQMAMMRIYGRPVGNERVANPFSK